MRRTNQHMLLRCVAPVLHYGLTCKHTGCKLLPLPPAAAAAPCAARKSSSRPKVPPGCSRPSVGGCNTSRSSGCSPALHTAMQKQRVRRQTIVCQHRDMLCAHWYICQVCQSACRLLLMPGMRMASGKGGRQWVTNSPTSNNLDCRKLAPFEQYVPTSMC